MKHVCASMVLFFMLVTASTAFALNPSRTYKQLPDKYNMEYTAHTVTTSDGAKLKAWHIPSKTKSTKLILISHNGEGNMANYLRRVDQFTSIGYNVVVYDYRGFGQSSDFKIANNMYIYPHFQKDFEAMVDFCRKKYASSFDVYGWGVGAGLSLGVGWNRAEVRAIPSAGYDKKNEPKSALGSAPGITKGHTKKVKLIVGSNDKLFKASDMKTLQAKQKTIVDRNIYVVENPDRRDNFSVNTTAYFKAIKTFLVDGK